ncbi:DNA cytosine methyltransferase [Acidocella facilis]|uniref:DNA cytosine methyltransferase n=1 Tax=Acidocella facilis TaxID=525 RepID=UPI001F476336|nr:DNA (cytosine-5-)-methyltransferase [Acidocella facilis]
MRYGSVCSGIEAATVAWEPLGWEPAFFAEIAKFPRAVLRHHYPEVPLHGDFTTIKAGQYGAIDLLVGGTPCQSFSIAGLRGGLDDERGNLALEFLRLAGRLCPRWILWENVPGVLSSNGGRDFGSFLGGLGELGYGFAYRCLDAQYFGLAQRRLRVFVVGYLGDWRRASAVLFEPESLRWDSPPRRQSRQDVAPTISARTKSGGGLGTDFDLDGGLIANPVSPPLTTNPYGDHESREALLIAAIQERAVSENSATGPDGVGVRTDGLAHTLEARSQVQAVAFGGNNSSGPIDVATALNASHTASGRQDFESETFITHALRADGFDASEDGTGRGTPIVPVAFSCKDHGADASEIAPTLRAMGFKESHANAGGQVAVAFAQNTRDEVREMPIAGALAAQPGMKQQSYIMLPEATAVALRGREGGATAELGGDISYAIRASTGGSDKAHILTHAVRRLTPKECERLQGFPDGHTRIPVRHYAIKRITKLHPADMWEPAPDGGWHLMAADGPRYMVLGNSMAVPVMRRIGERIAMMEAIINGAAWASKC